MRTKNFLHKKKLYWLLLKISEFNLFMGRATQGVLKRCLEEHLLGFSALTSTQSPSPSIYPSGKKLLTISLGKTGCISKGLNWMDNF